MFAELESPDQGSIGEAVAAKRIADLPGARGAHALARFREACGRILEAGAACHLGVRAASEEMHALGSSFQGFGRLALNANVRKLLVGEDSGFLGFAQ